MSNPFDLNALGPMMAGLQQNMARAQAEAATQTSEGQAGGGMVRVVVNGQMDVQSVRIDERAMADREMLEDLITAACNDAVRQSRAHMAEQTQKMLGGLPLPPGLLDGLLGP